MATIQSISVQLNPTDWHCQIKDNRHCWTPKARVARAYPQPEAQPWVEVHYRDNNAISVTAYPGLIRECPLRYTLAKGHLTIASSGQSLGSSQQINRSACLDFLLYGYATGQDTINSDVHQLMAGQQLTAELGKEIQLQLIHQYNQLPVEDKHSSKQWHQPLLELSEQAIESLIARSRHTPIILPLSGGFDSRYLAAMLKRGGAENVHCFAWGKPGNRDIEVSRQIAKALGYSWQAIDYSKESWLNALNTIGFDTLVRSTGDQTSISGLASLPFLSFLKQEYQGEGVMALGHTGDFIGGGHLPKQLNDQSTYQDVVDAIWNKHALYLQGDIYEAKARLLQQVQAIGAQLDAPYRAYECWELRERQSKFIVNTNRYYEQLGFDWSMPLWDYQYINLWSQVPPKLKHHLKLYDQFATQVLFKPLGISFPHDKQRQPQPLKTAIKQQLKRIKLIQALHAKHKRATGVADEFGFYTLSELVYHNAQTAQGTGWNQAMEIREAYQLSDARNYYAQLALVGLMHSL